MRTQPVSSTLVNFRSDDSVTKREDKVVDKPTEREITKKDKNVTTLVTAAVAIASLGVSVYALHGRGKSQTSEKGKEVIDDVANKAKDEAKKIADEAQNKINELTSKVQANEAKIAENQRWNDGFLDSLDKRVNEAFSKTEVVAKTSVRNTREIDGLNLIQNLDNSGNRILLPQEVRHRIKTAAARHIQGKDLSGKDLVIPILGAGASIWLPTAESNPEKEGGLGEVPTQVARNLTDLGVDVFLPRPINEIPGKSKLYQVNGQYYYKYTGLTSPKKDSTMPVEKLMEFNVDVVRNGQTEAQKVEVFYGKDPENGYKRLLFKNSDYFTASGLYTNSATATEPERYNFFSRALYDFAKFLADDNSLTSYSIFNEELLKTINAPDAMTLNDWHTAPIAALMRLKAPAEAANNELSTNAARKFEEMTLVDILHNADYQGWGGDRTSDMINTLFGKYSYDIYTDAETGFTEEVTTEDGDKVQAPIESLRKVLTINGCLNMANMGMALSTIVKPVSPTYAEEIATDPVRGQALTHIADQRRQHKTMVGQSNGWDKSINEVSDANLDRFNSDLNKDKLTLFKKAISETAGLNKEQVENLNTIIEKASADKLAQTIKDLRDLNYEPINKTLEQLETNGITKLRSFEASPSYIPMEKIISSRRHNKAELFDHIKTMVDTNKQTNRGIFNILEYKLTDLSDISPEELDDIPVFNMGVRFVSQKGVQIAAGAWKNILNDWDRLYPGKKRPLLITGGKDVEGGTHRETISNTKKELGVKGSHWVQMDNYVPNKILMAGSDWTMRPSYFEPDGDKWESLYKGTPAVLTRTGGHVDSIQDGFNGILTSRTMKQIRDELTSRGVAPEKMHQELTNELIKDYTEALKRALDAFYNKQAQQQYVDNAIHGNQSWVQKDNNGKIIECPLVGHMRDLGFDFSQFSQFSETVK